MGTAPDLCSPFSALYSLPLPLSRDNGNRGSNTARVPQGSSMSASNFHVMAKPIGPICNLDCKYCFYLEKEALYPQDRTKWAMQRLKCWRATSGNTSRRTMLR